MNYKKQITFSSLIMITFLIISKQSFGYNGDSKRTANSISFTDTIDYESPDSVEKNFLLYFNEDFKIPANKEDLPFTLEFEGVHNKATNYNLLPEGTMRPIGDPNTLPISAECKIYLKSESSHERIIKKGSISKIIYGGTAGGYGVSITMHSETLSRISCSLKTKYFLAYDTKIIGNLKLIIAQLGLSIIPATSDPAEEVSP